MAAKTKENEPLTVERILEAPVALVWRCITTPEDIARRSFDLKEFKPQPGFEFEFTVEHQGMTYRHLCKVTEVVPQKKIAYLAKDKTRVSIRMIFTTTDDRDFVVREHKAIEGGKQKLGRLAEYARKL